MTTIANYFVRKYPKGIGPDLFPLAALLSEVEKDESWTGEGSYKTLRTSTSAGASSTWANAMANQQPGSLDRFFIAADKYEYSLGQIANEAIAKAKDAGAVADVVDGETQSAMHSLSMGLSVGLHGNGGGAVAAATAVSTTNIANDTVTLKYGSDGARFQKYMWFQAAKDDGAFYVTAQGALAGTLGSGAKAQVLGVNFNPGGTTTVVFDRNLVTAWGAIGATGNFASGWFLFRDGDYANKFPGVDAWNPPGVPGTTTYTDVLGNACTIPATFKGVNRALDPQRLAGLRYSAGGISKEEAIIQASYLLPSFGIKGEMLCVANFQDVMKLQLTLRAKATLPSKEDPSMGFASVTLDGPTGKIRVLGDVYRQEGSFKLFRKPAFKLVTAGPIGFLKDLNGKMLMINPNADGVYFRAGCYIGSMSDAPNEMLHGTWA